MKKREVARRVVTATVALSMVLSLLPTQSLARGGGGPR